MRQICEEMNVHDDEIEILNPFKDLMAVIKEKALTKKRTNISPISSQDRVTDVSSIDKMHVCLKILSLEFKLDK